MNHMVIGFIGAGKAGIGLGAYFACRGIRIGGYYSKSSASAVKAAQITASFAYTQMPHLIRECDMIFITTPDDQIENVWRQLKQYDLQNRMICHVSGSLSSFVFEGSTQCGAFAYSIHPMYAFADDDGNTPGLETACFTIEGEPSHIRVVERFLSAMGNRVLTIEPEQKALYHAANVMVSNLALALFYAGEDCLRQSGIRAEDALPALLPLITGNLENLARNGLAASLTGPVERNDINTIQRHLSVIPAPYGSIYGGLSAILVTLAQQKHPDRDYAPVLRMLHEHNEEMGHNK